VEANVPGLSIAFAVKWDRYFKEWTFLQTSSPMISDDDGEKLEPSVGICVEGIRVDNSTPGFIGISLLAIANTTGKSSPRTNVARSGFEITSEHSRMLSAIYSVYCEHIGREIEAMHRQRNYSPTWAVNEANYLLTPLFRSNSRGARLAAQHLLENALSSINCMLLERNGTRELTSITEIRNQPQVWTIDSSGVASLEQLLREIPKPLSLSALSKLVEENLITLPPDPVLAGMRHGSILTDLALRNREVEEIRASESDRRIDLRWRNQTTSPSWSSLRGNSPRTRRFVSSRLVNTRRTGFSNEEIFCAKPGSVNVTGVGAEVGVTSLGSIFLLPDRGITNLLLRYISDVESSTCDPVVLVALNLLVREAFNSEAMRERPQERVFQILSEQGRLDLESADLKRTILSSEFISELEKTDWRLFNAKAWMRAGNSFGDGYYF